jgi:hypothetical protein
MKITFSLLIIVICAVGAFAQNNPVSGSIGINRPVVILSANTRYQLIPVNFYNFNLLKLDRFSGKTNFYEPSRKKWYPIDVRGGLPTPSTYATPKYEIYAEGEPILINTETGQTWFLNSYTRGWEPIPD